MVETNRDNDDDAHQASLRCLVSSQSAVSSAVNSGVNRAVNSAVTYCTCMFGRRRFRWLTVFTCSMVYRRSTLVECVGVEFHLQVALVRDRTPDIRYLNAHRLSCPALKPFAR